MTNSKRVSMKKRSAMPGGTIPYLQQPTITEQITGKRSWNPFSGGKKRRTMKSKGGKKRRTMHKKR